jgi:RNA polymerase sigma factor (sigma-70 family)
MRMADRRIESVDHQWEGLTGVERQAAYLRAARLGNRSALDALAAEMTPLVWHVARGEGVTRAVAEDVARTVWLALLPYLEAPVTPRALASWLITTTRREARRALRSAETPLAGDEDLLERTDLRNDLDRHMWAEFRQLPTRCQALLRLTVLAGRAEYSEVAETLRMPRGSIGPTKGRCLTTLRELLSIAEDPLPGSDEELLRQLDALLNKADAAPDGMATRMAFAMAVEDAETHIPIETTREALAASADQDEATSNDRAGAARSRDPEQPTARVLDQPFFVYVAGDDHQAAQELAAVITEKLAQQGIEAAPEGPPMISSWAQRFTLRVKGFLARSEVKQRLQKIEHALEVVAVQKPMSEVNAQHANAVDKLLSAAEKCDSFVVLVGSMLLVKHTDESGRVTAYAQTLSVAQVRAIERNQHLLKSPAKLLAHLETLSHTDNAPPTAATHGVNGAIQPSSQLDRRT